MVSFKQRLHEYNKHLQKELDSLKSGRLSNSANKKDREKDRESINNRDDNGRDKLNNEEK